MLTRACACRQPTHVCQCAYSLISAEERGILGTGLCIWDLLLAISCVTGPQTTTNITNLSSSKVENPARPSHSIPALAPSLLPLASNGTDDAASWRKGKGIHVLRWFHCKQYPSLSILSVTCPWSTGGNSRNSCNACSKSRCASSRAFASLRLFWRMRCRRTLSQ